jgi:uncharacterized protein YecT (DUF1311 family)
MRPVFFYAMAVLTVSFLVKQQDPTAYQKDAAAALQRSVVQTGKGDCPDAQTTLDIDQCLAGVQAKTKSNFDSFYKDLRSFLDPASEAARQLDASQAQWEKYSSSACDAIDSFYSGGTIRASAVTGCRLQLMRSRMQDLDKLYETVLHH